MPKNRLQKICYHNTFIYIYINTISFNVFFFKFPLSLYGFSICFFFLFKYFLLYFYHSYLAENCETLKKKTNEIKILNNKTKLFFFFM